MSEVHHQKANSNSHLNPDPYTYQDSDASDAHCDSK
jgi:hypothetical protein